MKGNRMFLGTIVVLVVSDISLRVAMVRDLVHIPIPGDKVEKCVARKGSELEFSSLITLDLETITSHHRSNETLKLKALTSIFST